MSTFTLTIKDTEDDGITCEGRIDPPEAIDQAPTLALVFGSYLGAHSEQVVKDAVTWFGQISRDAVMKGRTESESESAPQIIIDSRGTTV